MSLVSSLVFFPVISHDDPLLSLGGVLGEVNPGSSVFITRRTRLDDSWDEFQRELRGEISGEQRSEVVELSRVRVEVADVPHFYENGTNLLVDVTGKLPWGTELFTFVRDSIPETISGDYLPANCDLRVGMHDIWEAIESDDGTLFARPNFSVRFWGYSSPADTAGFRQKIMESAVLQDIKRKMEAVSGEVKVCFYLS
jgi:hypothetical protein